MKVPASSATVARFLACSALGVAFAASGAELKEKDAAKPARPASALEPASPGVFELRNVRLDNNRRTVSFPAAVNMSSNLVEYVVVCNDGKVHESLLKTSVEPQDIHVAMLLIGARGSPPQKPAEADLGKIQLGDKIRVWVEWHVGKDLKRVRAEDLVRNEETKKPMKQGLWVYNGSWIFDGQFVAQTERSILAIITDRNALANSSDPQRANDEIWFANTERIPNEGTPVRVEIELLPPTKAPKKPR